MASRTASVRSPRPSSAASARSGRDARGLIVGLPPGPTRPATCHRAPRSTTSGLLAAIVVLLFRAHRPPRKADIKKVCSDLPTQDPKTASTSGSLSLRGAPPSSGQAPSARSRTSVRGVPLWVTLGLVLAVAAAFPFTTENEYYQARSRTHGHLHRAGAGLNVVVGWAACSTSATSPSTARRLRLRDARSGIRHRHWRRSRRSR